MPRGHADALVVAAPAREIEGTTERCVYVYTYIHVHNEYIYIEKTERRDRAHL